MTVQTGGAEGATAPPEDDHDQYVIDKCKISENTQTLAQCPQSGCPIEEVHSYVKPNAPKKMEICETDSE